MLLDIFNNVYLLHLMMLFAFNIIELF